MVDSQLSTQPTSPTNTDTRNITPKEFIGWTLVGLALGGTAFIAARNFFRIKRSKTASLQATQGDAVAQLAVRIRLAFLNDMPWGMGSDEQALRQALLEIDSKRQAREVALAYNRRYNRDLDSDMQANLTSSEYREMSIILASKPERPGDGPIYDPYAWARRMKAAFEYTYWGMPDTDEEALEAVFAEFSSWNDFHDAAAAYLDLYGSNLEADLDDELDWFDFDWRETMNNK